MPQSMGPQRIGLDLVTEQPPLYVGELGERWGWEETRGKSKKSFMKMSVTGLEVTKSRGMGVGDTKPGTLHGKTLRCKGTKLFQQHGGKTLVLERRVLQGRSRLESDCKWPRMTG